MKLPSPENVEQPAVLIGLYLVYSRACTSLNSRHFLLLHKTKIFNTKHLVHCVWKRCL